MDANSNERRNVFDPTTADMLSTMEQRVKESHLPAPIKSRVARERNRLKQRRINQVALDLPEGLKPQLFQIAEKEGIPVSQVAAALLIVSLKKMKDGELSFWGFKKPSRCAKFEFVLDFEKWRNQFE